MGGNEGDFHSSSLSKVEIVVVVVVQNKCRC